MSDTRSRLVEACLETLWDRGLAGVSARAVAAKAEVNQALVFYHFKSVNGLIEEACRSRTASMIDEYRTKFAAVGSFTELLEVGRQLHSAEQRSGNLAIMAQVLAGAQRNPALRSAATEPLTLWVGELETVIQRLISGGPAAEIVDVPGIARILAASFIGIELYEGVEPAGAASGLEALERLAVVVEVLDELGPVAQRAVRHRLRRHERRRSR